MTVARVETRFAEEIFRDKKRRIWGYLSAETAVAQIVDWVYNRLLALRGVRRLVIMSDVVSQK